MKTSEHLRSLVTKLRRTPMPVADIIPALQTAADELDAFTDREKQVHRPRTSKRHVMNDIELPDPKYIYHKGLESGEDDLFLFAESGDVACPSCERLYTADQLRAAILAEREKRTQAEEGLLESFGKMLMETSPVQAEAPKRHWIVAKQVAADTGGARPELAYQIFEHVPAFDSFEDCAAAIREAGLPLGWVAIEADRLSLTPATKQAEAPTASNEREALRYAEMSMAAMRDALMPSFEYVGVSLRVSQEDHAAIRSALAGLSTSLHMVRAALATQQEAQPLAELCCGEYAQCHRPCTPRGRWLAQQETKEQK